MFWRPVEVAAAQFIVTRRECARVRVETIHQRLFHRLRQFGRRRCLANSTVRDEDLLTYPELMSPNQPQPRITLTKSPDYRDNYANSVQVRVNLWDFFLSFGLLEQNAPDDVQIVSFQGVFLSPQQAKALANVLNQNIQQYESAFGEIHLQPQAGAGVIQ